MADVSLIPLAIVVCVVFPFLLMVGHTMCGTYLAYHSSKPILQQTLVGLLNMDLAKLVIVAPTVASTMGTLDFLHRAGVDVPPAMFEWYTWVFQFTIQLAMIYVSHGVVVRYVYVLNHRMVFEEVSDTSARNVIMVFSALLSAAICKFLSVIDMKPEAYIAFVESTPSHLEKVKLDPIPGNASVAFAILTSTTLVINVLVRFALWREARGLQPSPDSAEDTAKRIAIMKKMFLVVIFMACLNLFRVFFDLDKIGIPTSQFMTIVMTIVTDSIIMKIVLSDNHMRKLVKSRFKNTFRKLVIRLFKPNAVSPAA